MRRAAFAVATLSVLGTVQCARLESLGSACGNGAVESQREDCDGSSYISTATPTPGRAWACEPAGGVNACRFACGLSVSCPNDDWVCRSGICVNVVDEFVATPLDKVGSVGHVSVTDLDGDKVDDVLAEPMSINAPYVAHFAIADSAGTSTTPLFPAEAAALVQYSNGSPPAIAMQLDDGARVTIARAAGLRELESVPLASAEVQAAAIDFLSPAENTTIFTLYPGGDTVHLALFAWVHGAKGNDDTFSRFDFTNSARTDFFKMAAMDQHGAQLDEHRIVIAIPSDSKIPCTRFAVFTRDAADPSSGLLQILTPELTRCDWLRPHKTYAIPGRYPASRQAGAVFVADLDGDGDSDLIVNARKTTESASEPMVLRGPLDGQLVPILDNKVQTVVVGVGRVQGYAHPALLTCNRVGALVNEGLCISESTLQTLMAIRYPNDDASAYTGALVAADSIVAGFADLNGDGYDDIWTWGRGGTGPSYIETTPDGFFRSSLIDHGSPAVISVASGSLDESKARDLVAVTELASDLGVTSEVRVTRGHPLAQEMVAKVVARLPGHVKATVHDAFARRALPSIALVSCDSSNCNQASNSRDAAPFTVTPLRPLAPDWLAAPAYLGCYDPQTALFDRTDPHPRLRKRLGVVALPTKSTTGVPDVQVVTVATGKFASGSIVATLRWGRLRAGKVADQIRCGDAESIPIAHLTESVALAPTITSIADAWLMLGTYSKTTKTVPDPRDLKGVAYALTPLAPPKETRIIPAPAFGDYRAIYAESHDIDGDGDSDFVVLERKDSPDGTSAARPAFYVNAPCDDAPQERCLFVKYIDMQVKKPDGTADHFFVSASGDGVSLQRSHIDEARDAKWPEWWLAILVGDAAAGTGKVVTQRIRIAGVDRNVTFAPSTSDPPREVPTPRSDATHQEVAWGDIDGDGALDLLYTTDRGSRLYRRAQQK